jgi:hypothetical protein
MKGEMNLRAEGFAAVRDATLASFALPRRYSPERGAECDQPNAIRSGAAGRIRDERAHAVRLFEE